MGTAKCLFFLMVKPITTITVTKTATFSCAICALQKGLIQGGRGCPLLAPPPHPESIFF